MGRIARLDDVLVDQIAAGEVVERPASVVKELVENSIDAGATTIEVQLKGGGRDLIRVVDDGSGMDRHDAELCLQRHATSKIRSASDLAAIATLGFRGEAIPSIASVSRFELLTKPAGQEAGTRVRADGGVLSAVEDAGMAGGTEFNVRELFYNLPVRRKFLRTAGTELGHCIEAVTRPALVHPEIDFTVRHQGRVVLRAPQVDGLAERARDLLGEVGRALLPVSFEAEGFAVDGLVSPPGISRASRTGATYLYVNGRFVRDPVFRRAVTEAYEGLLPSGRHPVMVLQLQLDPTRVDVNAHPSKIEVRFREPRDLVRVVSQQLRAVLLDAPATPQPAPVPSELPLTAASSWRPSAWSPPPPERLPSIPSHPDDDPVIPEWAPPPPYQRIAEPDAQRDDDYVRDETLPARRYRELKPIGVLAGRWILAEDSHGLVVVDHVEAALALATGALDVQIAEGERTLLDPAVPVDLKRGQAPTVQEALQLAGIDSDPFGNGGVIVRAVPPALAHADIAAAVQDLAHDPSLATLAAHVPLPALGDDPTALRTLLASLDEVDAGLLGARFDLDEVAQRCRRR